MVDRDPLGVTISAREIYDEIVGLREDVRSLTQSNEGVDRQLTDHEERLRKLEAWRYALPVTAAAGVVSAVITLAR